MKRTVTILLTTLLVALFATTGAIAQESGDFRSAADGDWSATATWETYNGSEWVDADAAPNGSENISITDTVSVDVDGAITGYITVLDEGVLEVADGASLTFNDGGTYDHARDGGDMPGSTWEMGSTAVISGTVNDAPGNSDQSFYNIVLNTPDKTSNKDLGLSGQTIGGDITVTSTGSSRWYLMGGSSGTSEDDLSTSEVTIMGDVTVEAGQFSVQGTSSPFSEYIVNHHGNVNVTGGNFSIARGSQSGLGTTTWNFMTDGASFTMADAETQSSNQEGGEFVFAGAGTQTVNFTNVDFKSTINWGVSDSTTLEVADGSEFLVTGVLTNEGTVEATGTLTIDNDGTYDHARNGGDIPDAVWADGSTTVFSGITTDAPGNRGQDYYNLTINTPGHAGNKDLSMDGVTLGGNLRVVDTGSSRWRLFGGSAGTVTIMGDVVVEGGELETNGTGSVVDQVVEHHGNVIVTGGTFAISRGSMGDGTPEGTGSVTWNLHEGDFSVTDAQVRNSISLKGNAKFVFASDTVQTLEIGDGVEFDQLPFEVASGATLHLGGSVIAGNDIVNVYGTIATEHEGGFEAALQTEGDITVGENGEFMYNGSAEQNAALEAVADSVGAITVANAEGVVFADSVYTAAFNVSSGATARIDTTGDVSVGGGSVEGTLVNIGSIETTDGATLTFGAEATYEHAQDGGSMPMGTWSEGSTALFTGTVVDAPDNRAQDYYNVTFNAPDQVSNVDLDLDGNTISGDIHVISTGLARWYLTSPSGDPEVTKEVTVMGDITMEAGAFSSNGSGNPGDIVVHHYGSVTVNDGNFSVSRGSQASGTSSTNWYFYEGDMTLNAGTSQNSNPNNAQWVFAGGPDVVHNLTLAEDYDINGSGMQMVVSDSSALDLNSSALNSGGNFTVEAGGTLWSSHPESFDGNLSEVTGTVDITNESYFVLDGDDAQITSFTMPLVVNGLTIDNEAGVTQSRGLTINEFLLLKAGEFDNTVGFTLGTGAEIIYEGGSLTIPVSNENEGEGIPDEFALNQNYPNPFNPTTTISYDVPEAADVTLTVFDITGREVAQLVNSRQSAGVYEVDWNAQNLATGVYIYRIQAGSFTAVRKLTLIK